MAGRPGRRGQRGHHVPRHPPPRLDAKKKTLAATERSEEARAAWRDAVAGLDPQRFVFLDEAGANTGLTPRYARAPKGERAHGAAPRNHGQNITLVAALTPAGLQAPMTLLGALDSDAFAAYARAMLVPTLRPGDIVWCDNLSAHKRADIRPLIEAAGCELRFFPPYSPDFNPIELVFSKLKEALRRAGARTQAAVEAAIAAALETISVQDATNCFRHCGYALDNQ